MYLRYIACTRMKSRVEAFNCTTFLAFLFIVYADYRGFGQRYISSKLPIPHSELWSEA